MFVMAIFLWLGFVDAQTCPTSEWASNSNGWTAYTTTITTADQELWYINKSSTINNICAWNTDCVNYVCNTISRSYDTQERITACSSSISDLYSSQLILWNKYNETKNNMRDWWYDSESIKNLQELMQEAWCQNHVDCKLGVKTSHAFLFCPVCTAINNDRKDLDVNWWCDEHWDYVETEDNLCCQPIPSQCVDWEWVINNPGGDKYTSNDSEFAVYIDFSSNTVWDLDYNFNNIEIIWATLEWDIVTGGDSKTVLFSISPEADSDEINITIQDGFAKLWEYNCSVEIAPIYRDVECQPRNEREECNNNSDFEASEEPIIDYSFLDGFYCEKGVSEPVPFCECTTPSKMNNCSDYGTWRIEDNNGCCISCGKDKIYDFEKDECVCDPNKKCSKEWYTVDPATCKCKCDPTKTCCGIELNTVVPFIGDCIEMTSQNNTMDPNDPNTSRVNQLNAFPFLMMGLSKIMVTVILIFSFLIVISAGLLMTTGALDGKWNQYSKWVEMVKNVVIGLILLWSSGLILRLINPNFFWG